MYQCYMVHHILDYFHFCTYDYIHAGFYTKVESLALHKSN